MTISISVKPRRTLFVLTAKIIWGAFLTVRAFAEHFEIIGPLFSWETVAILRAPWIGGDLAHHLHPAPRHRRAGWLVLEGLEALLSRRERPSVELVHREGAFEALEVRLHLAKFRRIADATHRKDRPPENHGNDTEHDDHFKQGETGTAAEVSGWMIDFHEEL